MGKPVIVDAIRTPIGKRNGVLSGQHPSLLLGHVQRALLARNGIAPAAVGQIIGGCVTQVGEQAFNITRMAWLAAGLPWQVGATTIDCQCGASQQANHLVHAMIAADVIEIGVACGVEVMSRVAMGANISSGPGQVKPPNFPYDLPHQFVAAERVAQKRGLTRQDADEVGLASQQKAAAAYRAGRFDREIVEIPILGTGLATILRDEGLRETSAHELSKLQPIHPGGIHTAGNTSQISDGAAAVLWMDQGRAEAMGLRPRARIRAQALVGSDPFFHIEGPLDATRAVLTKSAMTIGDIDLFEVNEAFAAVVISWIREYQPEISKINVNGGAIALGHPLGASGARLITSALYEMERSDSCNALITMCCGGAIGTATILERI